MKTLELVLLIFFLIIGSAMLIYLPFYVVQESGWYGVGAIAFGLVTSYYMLRLLNLINR